MKNIGEDIWVHNDAMRLAGMPLRLRMTIIKLANDSLWVHSPTALSLELKREIERLGAVGFIVGASNGHNLWLREWQNAFTDAALYVSGGIPKKLKLTNYQVLDESQRNIWQEDLEWAYMGGVPFFSESVFLHKKSKSLIVTDFIQNHSGRRPAGLAGLLARCILEPVGFKGICVAPPLKMRFMIKHQSKFISFVETIRNWDFERIIVTHGDIVEPDAEQIFASLTERFVE